MRHLALFLALVPFVAHSQVNSADVEAGPLDGGKMWLFEDPPTDYLEETYGFRPDEAWFERAKLAALRMPGCSASFVSPNGLVATNHHCGQGSVISVSQLGEGLLDNGFAAQSLAEERPVEDMYMDQLVDIADVTDQVTGMIDAAGAQTDAEAAAAATEAVEAVQESMGAELGDGFNVQVVGLYNGGRYSAYTFRRYTDVRLVMAPEARLGYFGGDFDNFTYPRYALDFSFFRIYGDDGQPLHSDHYFPLSTEGVEEDDLIFVVGNPGSTSRGFTVAQLETTRDFQVPIVLQFIDERVETLQAHLAEGPENPDAVRGQLFGLLNAQKAYRGRRAALRDNYIMARRAAGERDFRSDSPAAAELIDAMAALQGQQREMGNERRAFQMLFNRRYGAATLHRARAAYEAGQAGIEDPDYAAILEVEDRPPSVELGYLTAEIKAIRGYYETTLAQAYPPSLAGSDAAAVAQTLMDTSALSSAASAEAAIRAVSLSNADPAIQLVTAIMPYVQGYVSASRGLGARERDLARRLGQERFATYGSSVPPDATFSLRFTDGIVKGYPYNGTVAPPHTTLFGLFDHHYSYGADSDWGLPQRWLDAADNLDMSTPVNFTSTSDTIGGNSGSPALNQNLELVGLNFDRTIEGLLRDYIYLPDRGRNVMVDVRVILEALENVYGLNDLVAELTTGVMVE